MIFVLDVFPVDVPFFHSSNLPLAIIPIEKQKTDS